MQEISNNDGNSALNEFLSVFEGQTEAGLFIVKNGSELSHLVEVLASRGFELSSEWLETFIQLKAGKRVALIISGGVTKQVYDLVAQYNDRQGMIQLLDPETFQYHSAHLDINQCKLLLITSNITASEDVFPILSKVGLIGRGA